MTGVFRLYHNSAHGIRTLLDDKTIGQFGKGDVVGCGIVMETTKFTADGSIEPQQELDVYFMKNGAKVRTS